MNEREKTIRLWFDMWLNQQDMGIDDIFTEDVIYTESWSPQYNNRIRIIHTITRNQYSCGLQTNLFSDWQQNGNIL